MREGEGPVAVAVAVERPVCYPKDRVRAVVTVANRETHPAGTAKVERVMAFLRAEERVDRRKVDVTGERFAAAAAGGPWLHRPLFKRTGVVLAGPGRLGAGGSWDFLVELVLPEGLPPAYAGTAVQYVYALEAEVVLVRDIARGKLKARPPVAAVAALQLWAPRVWRGHYTADFRTAEALPAGEVRMCSSALEGRAHRAEGGRVLWDRVASASRMPSQQSYELDNDPGAENGDGGSPSHAGTPTPSNRALDNQIMPEYLAARYLPRKKVSAPGRPATAGRSGGLTPRAPARPPQSLTDYANGSGMMQAAYKVAVFGQTLAQIRLSGLLELGYATPGGLLGATLDFSAGGQGAGGAAAVRCLDLKVNLEQHEKLRGAGGAETVTTKIVQEFAEMTEDLDQTYFMLNIPLDAPTCFVTSVAEISWTLDFRFVVKVDGRREAVDWSLPVLVLSS